MGHALAFAEIDPEMTSPPSSWVEKYGPTIAQERFRVAKAAWANGQNVPYGMTLARAVMGDWIKAQAQVMVGNANGEQSTSGYRATAEHIDPGKDSEIFEELLVEDNSK